MNPSAEYLFNIKIIFVLVAFIQLFYLKSSLFLD